MMDATALIGNVRRELKEIAPGIEQMKAEVAAAKREVEVMLAHLKTMRDELEMAQRATIAEVDRLNGVVKEILSSIHAASKG